MSRDRYSAFSLLEVFVALASIGVLLAVLLPGLSAARSASYREVCADNQRLIGLAWFAYIEDHNDRLPLLLAQPSWQYGGCRFSVATGETWLDRDRPLTRYMPGSSADVDDARTLFRSPADRGIRGGSSATGMASDIGTGDRTVYRAFGTSYRANHWLLNARAAGLDHEDRAVARSEILTSPARLVLMGSPTWFETYEQTGRSADWYGDAGLCNLLFMDGSVRFRTVSPRGTQSPISFEPHLYPEDLRGLYGPAR